ncbi:MAG: permease-like cell division protein FtsX [Ruminococcus sp.]|nr:permease-like cell division protein FtsX [Ruminococcus sp.]
MSSLGYLIKEGFKNLFNNRMMSLASIGVLISCLVLTGSAVMLTVNVTNIVDSVSDKNLTNVYLNDDMDHLHAVAIGQDLLAVDHVVDAQLIEKDEAMEAYREQLGEDIFQNMTGKGNPFPYSYRITVDTETMQNVEQYDAVVEQLKQVKLVRNGEVLGSVASVSSHRDMAQKLTSLSSLITMMSFWIILALAVISLFIIANTIRMTMFSHRFEISIMKSVGATNAFVRIPFIVEGIIIGLVSAAVSIAILFFLSNAVIAAVKSILPFRLTPLTDIIWYITGAFVGAGVIVGALGSLLSISRFLKREGNEILGW